MTWLSPETIESIRRSPLADLLLGFLEPKRDEPPPPREIRTIIMNRAYILEMPPREPPSNDDDDDVIEGEWQ